MFFRLRPEATICRKIKFSGIGVHSGVVTNMSVLPAMTGAGITFRRVDVNDKNPVICLSPETVTDPTMCTRIANRAGISVAVIEHLLAAFRICGINNAEVEVDAGEIPIMDGSAIEFVKAFKRVGIVYQNAFVPAIVISKPVSVSYKSASISIVPSRKAKLSVELNYERILPVVGKNNTYSFSFNENLTEIAEARTFGWLADYEKVLAMGLAKGTSEENTIVISADNTIKNAGGLRNPKEIVMHKCLDLIGDISVLGYDIVGKIECTNPSHYANNLLMRKLLSEISEHELVTAESEMIRCSVQVA